MIDSASGRPYGFRRGLRAVPGRACVEGQPLLRKRSWADIFFLPGHAVEWPQRVESHSLHKHGQRLAFLNDIGVKLGRIGCPHVPRGVNDAIGNEEYVAVLEGYGRPAGDVIFDRTLDDIDFRRAGR